MSGIGKYVWAGFAVAVLVHLAIIYAAPRVLMNVAIERLGGSAPNAWRFGDRITPDSRAIVRPSPDFAYSACPYDLGAGPVIMRVAPWGAYWSLSLYDESSDNFYTLNDREAREGGAITLVRGGGGDLEGVIVRSPTRRGIALMRRLAPTPETHAAARQVAANDMCAPLQP